MMTDPQRTQGVKTGKVREVWIDNAKAFAIILVILGHVGTNLAGWFNFSFVYGFHLVVFFLLSGYTARRRKVDAAFVNQRFRRLMIPYFITCSAIMVMDIINTYYHDRLTIPVTRVIADDLYRTFFASGTHTDIASSDLGVRIGAIWFLPALFFSVLIFQLLLEKISNEKLLGVVCALITILGYISGRFFWLPFSVQSAMFAVFFLWAGYFIKQHNVLAHVKWYHYLVALVILLAGIYLKYCDVGFVTAWVKDLIISTLVGFCGALLVYLLARITVKVKLISLIGQQSLYVLCIHLFALETMGMYFARVLDLLRLNGQLREWTWIIINILFALVGTFILLFLKDKCFRPLKDRLAARRAQKTPAFERDMNGDIARGILVFAIFLTYFEIDEALRNIILSCTIAGFVFLSGYFRRVSGHIGKDIGRAAQTLLLPYLICLIGNFLADIPVWSGAYFAETIKRYVCGMSGTGIILSDVGAVGPVYFLLLLFVVRILYLLIDRIARSEIAKWIVVLVCAAAGIVLGHFRIYLPWSIDAALYCLIFYRTGVFFKSRNVPGLCSDNPWTYFILSPILAFMIWRGSMDIESRMYSPYGTVIIGALAGTVLIYMLSSYLKHALILLSSALAVIGRASLILLFLYICAGGYIGRLISSYLDPVRFDYLVLNMLILLVAAGFLRFLFEGIWRKTKRTSKAHYN